MAGTAICPCHKSGNRDNEGEKISQLVFGETGFYCNLDIANLR